MTQQEIDTLKAEEARLWAELEAIGNLRTKANTAWCAVNVKLQKALEEQRIQLEVEKRLLEAQQTLVTTPNHVAESRPE